MYLGVLEKPHHKAECQCTECFEWMSQEITRLRCKCEDMEERENMSGSEQTEEILTKIEEKLKENMCEKENEMNPFVVGYKSFDNGVCQILNIQKTFFRRFYHNDKNRITEVSDLTRKQAFILLLSWNWSIEKALEKIPLHGDHFCTLGGKELK